MRLKRWCVKSREGWCALLRNRKQSEALWSAETRCGYFVILPFGVDQRVPTCPDCLRLLLPRTPWARQFKRACPASYEEALRRAGEPVVVYKTNETGESQWVVSLEDGFWMDGFPSEAEARQLVADMGWPSLD